MPVAPLFSVALCSSFSHSPLTTFPMSFFLIPSYLKPNLLIHFLSHSLTPTPSITSLLLTLPHSPLLLHFLSFSYSLSHSFFLHILSPPPYVLSHTIHTCSTTFFLLFTHTLSGVLCSAVASVMLMSMTVPRDGQVSVILIENSITESYRTCVKMAFSINRR
jgi:hypothetical protein